MDIVSDIIKTLSGAAPHIVIIIAIFLTSLILLIIKDKILLPLKYVWIAWVVILFSGSLITSMAGMKVYNKICEIQDRKNIIEKLHTLTPEEKKFLNYFVIKENKKHFWIANNFWRDITAATLLEKDGIIHKIDSINHHKEAGYLYGIDDYYFDYIQQNSSKLFSK
ncbi:hypothetical protein ACFL7M_05660 [Thermodesulfobacteriota bacterium]